tara:strand:- start:27 stop:272 length:246 start_codon:yes stop_codon:yes gene_type:complete
LQNDQNTELIEIDGITENIAKSLQGSNIKTVSDLMEADEESLLEIKGIASSTIEKVYSSVQEFIEREDSKMDDSIDADEEE